MRLCIPTYDGSENRASFGGLCWELDAGFNFISFQQGDGPSKPMTAHQEGKALRYFKARLEYLRDNGGDNHTDFAIVLGLCIHHGLIDSIAAMNDVRDMLERADSDEERDRLRRIVEGRGTDDA